MLGEIGFPPSAFSPPLSKGKRILLTYRPQSKPGLSNVAHVLSKDATHPPENSLVVYRILLLLSLRKIGYGDTHASEAVKRRYPFTSGDTRTGLS